MRDYPSECMRASVPAIIVFFLSFSSCVTLDFRSGREQGAFVMTPQDSRVFWRKAMTPETARRYRATKKGTLCNIYVGDTLRRYFGADVFNRIFPHGVKSPHLMIREWRTNPALERLDPALFSLEEIQALADRGYLILLSYYYARGSSHLAFVGHSRLTLFTVPQIRKLEGKIGSALDRSWRPIVVQAGTYAGVTSIAYASNGWFTAAVNLYQAGTVRLYLVRR